ncbi:MAG: 3-keto-disaccharide hydrolase [Pirellulaceae bacterium]
MSRPSLWVLFSASVIAVCTCGFVGAGESVSLFDGKTLDGWDVLKCQAVVKDNAILLESGNGLVQAKQRYGDFVLEFEYKALKSEAWDSGVYFRYSEVPENSPWPERYQVNLRQGGEGDLVGFDAGKNEVPTKPGEWNRFELTVKGSVASLKVNGKAAWKVDGIEVPSGHIALQAEIPGGGQFLFRNIRITDQDK